MSLSKMPLSKTEQSIRELSFFSRINEEQITQLAAISHLESYPKSYLLHYEGSISKRILFLVSGLAKAYKIDKYDNEVFLYYIYPDSLLSDLSSLREDTLLSYANVTIEEDAQLLSIDYAKFKHRYIDNAFLSQEIFATIIQQSKQLQTLINREFVLDSVGKVSMMLDQDLAIFNRRRRSDISLMLHLQPATLSRVLNRLRRDGIIMIDKGEITVSAPDRLQSLYQGSL